MAGRKSLSGRPPSMKLPPGTSTAASAEKAVPAQTQAAPVKKPDPVPDQKPTTVAGST
jgi:hypothetical protein